MSDEKIHVDPCPHNSWKTTVIFAQQVWQICIFDSEKIWNIFQKNQKMNEPIQVFKFLQMDIISVIKCIKNFGPIYGYYSRGICNYNKLIYTMCIWACYNTFFLN